MNDRASFSSLCFDVIHEQDPTLCKPIVRSPPGTDSPVVWNHPGQRRSTTLRVQEVATVRQVGREASTKYELAGARYDRFNGSLVLAHFVPTFELWNLNWKESHRHRP